MLQWGLVVFLFSVGVSSNPVTVIKLTPEQVEQVKIFGPALAATLIMVGLGEAIIKAIWRLAHDGMPFGGFFAPIVDGLGNAMTASRTAGMRSQTHYNFIRGKMTVAQRRFYQGTVIFMVIGAVYLLIAFVSALASDFATLEGMRTARNAIGFVFQFFIFACLLVGAIIINEQIEVKLWRRHEKEFHELYTVEITGTDRRGRTMELWKKRDASEMFGVEAVS